MENCVITNVMTRRVSERIRKERESFLILVEEYSASDTNSEDDYIPSSPEPKRKRSTKVKKEEDNDVFLGKLSPGHRNKPNNFADKMVQMCPDNPEQVDTRPPTCHVCQRSLKTLNDLNYHGINHYTQVGTVLQCNVCSQRINASDRGHARLHMMKYHNYVRYKCEHCSRTFHSPGYANTHMRHEHGGVKYQCNECDKSFSQNANLKSHIESQHRGNFFICYHCDKKFTNRALLCRHIASHMQETCYTCDVCGRSMRFLKSYQKHMKFHQGGSDFACNICGRTFVQKVGLQQHMERHTAPEYKCNLCGRKYRSKKLLELHVLRHIGLAQFKCEVCGNLYAHQKYLDEHMTLHQGHVYQCNQCDKTYKNLHNLKRHFRMSHDKLKFICNDCGKSFTSKECLVGHLVVHDDQRKMVLCTLCDHVVKKDLYKSHCKSMKHIQKLEKLKPSRKKRICVEI